VVKSLIKIVVLKNDPRIGKVGDSQSLGQTNRQTGDDAGKNSKKNASENNKGCSLCFVYFVWDYKFICLICQSSQRQ